MSTADRIEPTHAFGRAQPSGAAGEDRLHHRAGEQLGEHDPRAAAAGHGRGPAELLALHPRRACARDRAAAARGGKRRPHAGHPPGSARPEDPHWTPEVPQGNAEAGRTRHHHAARCAGDAVADFHQLSSPGAGRYRGRARAALRRPHRTARQSHSRRRRRVRGGQWRPARRTPGHQPAGNRGPGSGADREGQERPAFRAEARGGPGGGVVRAPRRGRAGSQALHQRRKAPRPRSSPSWRSRRPSTAWRRSWKWPTA